MPRPRGDRRSRQNSNRGTSYAENEFNPDREPQYFQIFVNVLEARKLIWSNPSAANSYVIVVFGKKRHRTGIRRNMEEPYYREYFVFEMYSSILDIQRSSLWLAVMEPRCYAPPRLLGEATVDLGSIWAQPHHQVYHKWAQLTLPRDPSIGPVGFLKVDISLIYRGEVQVMPAMVTEEKVEDLLLLPSGSEQQRANYLITIYAAFCLPAGDRRHAKPPSTFVRITFCGLMAKTAVQPRNYHPTYSEQISIVEMFPNMNQVLRLEVCHADGCFNKVLADTDLMLGQVSHDGENGFLPTFGPSLLHMYGAPSSNSFGTSKEDDPYHRGALLVSLKTIVPYYQQGVRSINVEPVAPVQMDSLWIHEDFCIFIPILEISMLDRRIAGTHCGIAVTIAEIPCNKRSDEDFMNLMNCIKSHKLHYTGAIEVIKSSPSYGIIDLQNSFPVLQLATRLPDFRFRIFRNNMAHGIVAELESALSDVDRRLKTYEYATPSELMDELNKTLDDAAGNILKYLDIIQYSSREETEPHHITELDQKQLALQKEEIEKIYEQMSKKFKGESSSNIFEPANSTRDSLAGTRKGVKLLLAEAKALTNNLRNIIHKTPDGWPEIVVWLLNGGSRVAFHKISPADVIYSVIPEQRGKNCGRTQTIYMKPLKCPKHMSTSSNCFCIAAKVELVFWMGLFRQTSAFETCLPFGYSIRHSDYNMKLKSRMLLLEYRAFIYRAKLSTVDENSCNRYSFVRINILNSVKETKVKLRTNAPIWNQVLKVQRVVFMTMDRVRTNAPVALVEVYDNDLKSKIDLVGRSQITPTVDDNAENEHLPKLQWYDIFKGSEHTGQILMSMQVVQIPEKLMKNTVYSNIEEMFCETEYHGESDTAIDEVEPLPPILVPKSICYKVDIYWWGLRDVNITRKPCVTLEIDDMTIKSSIIGDKKCNSNFPNGRSSQIFEAPLTEMYSPSLTIKLYDSSTFGRTMFLGTKFVKNPNKYIVNWLPKAEREASLMSASIMSSAFYQVSDAVYLKKYPLKTDANKRLASNLSVNGSLTRSKIKQSKWRRLFSRKEPDEEEYTLLPVYVKEIGSVEMDGKATKSNENGWWTRYFHSLEESNDEEGRELDALDKITIYDSELELQPEFGKFRDWCSTMKLYNGAKTGIPEKDEQLLCGYLKAGIAIYKWPPPANTVAVSTPGVDLDNGYFFNHPNNSPGKYLVRVYIVKAMNLAAKYFTGKSDPYIVISCGKKHLGDRNKYIKDTVDPIFGNMYEFRCNLPEDYKLSLSVYDYDPIPPDELIGSTCIDLENRVYTKHRAQLGLPAQYNRSGPMKWRDFAKPSVILEELCAKNNLPPPTFPDSSSVFVNGIEYRDDSQDTSNSSAADRKENICLNLLHNWHTLPICGYRLVPEHVETRTLYNPDKPGIEQGKLQMWLDFFPMDTYSNCAPPPVDVKFMPAHAYELRVIVWDVKNILLDNSERTGKFWKVTDLYVKAWIGDPTFAQQTDIHYNSFDGTGNFNWRMIFRILYHEARKRILIKKVEPFIEHEEYRQPVLVVQLLESDQDEILGSLALNLNRLPLGAKLDRQCTLDALSTSRRINMFDWNSTRSWWPLKTVDTGTGKDIFAGAIDMEIILLSEDQACAKPAGLGRDPPCPMPEPVRQSQRDRICERICKSICSASEIILIFMVVVGITLSFIVCVIYSGVPVAWHMNGASPRKNVEGIRTLYPVRI